jgi:hypothetical protein
MGLQPAEYLPHDPVYVHRALVPVTYYPGVELRAADHNPAAHAIRGQGVGGIVQMLAKLSHAKAAVACQGLERQKGVQGRADDDPFGENTTNLGRFS